MKKRTVTTIPIILAMIFGVMNVEAQDHQHQHGETKPPAQSAPKDAHQHGSMDAGKMMNEPHHLLAMAYAENMARFAKVLEGQVKAANSVDAEFARAAIGELRRSFDTMQQHLGEHSKTAPASQAGHAGMMQAMNAHVSAIRQSLTALGREIDAANPSAARVSERAAEIVRHIDEMSHSHGEHKGH